MRKDKIKEQVIESLRKSRELLEGKPVTREQVIQELKEKGIDYED